MTFAGRDIAAQLPFARLVEFSGRNFKEIVAILSENPAKRGDSDGQNSGDAFLQLDVGDGNLDGAIEPRATGRDLLENSDDVA